MTVKKIFFGFIAFLFLSADYVMAASSDEKKHGEHGHQFHIEEILDAHSCHIIGDYHLPLPIILYGNNGWSFFMSSEFEHDHSAKVVVEKNGDRYVIHGEKIYFASDVPDENGEYLSFDKEGHILNGSPLDFSISRIVFSMLMAATILVLLFMAMAKSYKKNEGKPRGVASFLEPIILFVRDGIAKPNLKDKYERYMPFLLTIFFFIWINNLLGLLPIFPLGANVSGNIAFTMVLALITFVITNINGNKQYWKHIFNTPGVPWWLKFPIPLIPLIEFIGLFTKPFSLTVRLFANITSGHVLVGSLLFFPMMFQSYIVGGVSSLFLVFILLIELLVGFIQAFIFTILSSLYIGMAIDDHH